MPDLNASVNYGAQAIGGVGLLRGRSAEPESSGRSSATSERSYWDTLGTMFAGDFPGWTVSVRPGLPDRQVDAGSAAGAREAPEDAGRSGRSRASSCR